MILYTYAAIVTNVIDGDTIDAQVDLGFCVHVQVRLRLNGLNCPEHGTPEGTAATKFAADWIAKRGGKVFVRTFKDKREKYGRMLATVTDSLGDVPACLNDDLLNSGNAVPYYGGKR